MHLTPTEQQRLLVFQAAELARHARKLDLLLNAPEATALIVDALHWAARQGRSYLEVIDAGRSAVRPDEVLDGVADLVTEVRVEVLLDEGSRLIVLRAPLVPEVTP